MDAIQLVDGRAHIGSECRGCGRCVDICPNQAIKLTIQGGTNIEEIIQRLSQRVDVQ